MEGEALERQQLEHRKDEIRSLKEERKRRGRGKGINGQPKRISCIGLRYMCPPLMKKEQIATMSIPDTCLWMPQNYHITHRFKSNLTISLKTILSLKLSVFVHDSTVINPEIFEPLVCVCSLHILAPLLYRYPRLFHEKLGQ